MKTFLNQRAAATWILIIGGILLTLIFFTVVVHEILKFSKFEKRKNLLAKFQNFVETLNWICIEGGVGYIYHETFILTDDVEAIYAANSEYELPPDDVPIRILEGDTNTGNFICLKFYDEEVPRCIEIYCSTNFTYIGKPFSKPTLFSILKRLKGADYKFSLIVNKTNFTEITVTAIQTI